MKRSARSVVCALILSVGSLAFTASAETIVNQTYTGTFPAMISGTLANQDTVLEETFTLANPGTVTAYTTSYASGGFQPNLTLFDSNGIAISNQWATPPSTAKADPSTGQTLDSYLMSNPLMAGTYVLTVTDWALNQSATATSLADGFKSNFGNGMTFVDVAGNTRTGDYALNLSVSGSASPVPEPASFLLLAPAVLGAFLFRKRSALSR
jgi:hypothetical protein